MEALNDRIQRIESAMGSVSPRGYSRKDLSVRIGVKSATVSKLIKACVIKAPSGERYTEDEVNEACIAYRSYKMEREKERQYDPPVPVSPQEMIDAKRQACIEASRQSAGYSGSIRRRFYSSVRLSVLTEIAKAGGPCIWMCGNRAAPSKALCSDCQKRKVTMRHRRETERDERRSVHGQQGGGGEGKDSAA